MIFLNLLIKTPTRVLFGDGSDHLYTNSLLGLSLNLMREPVIPNSAPWARQHVGGKRPNTPLDITQL